MHMYNDNNHESIDSLRLGRGKRLLLLVKLCKTINLTKKFARRRTEDKISGVGFFIAVTIFIQFNIWIFPELNPVLTFVWECVQPSG